MSLATRGRAGRPPRLDANGTGTRERLLEAAAAACVAQGFEGATVQDIARRAGVSAPAIYHWFGGREALLVAAGRHALDAIGTTATPPRALDVTRAFLADSFAPTRRLLSELHMAGQRHAEVAALLADWHRHHLTRWVAHAPGPRPEATVTAFFALLLGICQLDALAAIDARSAEVRERIETAVQALFPEEAP